MKTVLTAAALVLVAIAATSLGSVERSHGVEIAEAKDPAASEAEPPAGAETQEPSGEDAAAPEEGLDALPETPKLPVKSEQFPELFKQIEDSADAQSAHRSCPADVFDKSRPFWRRWWDAYVGDTDLSLDDCGEDPLSCSFMCLTLRGADACFTTARLIQDNAERKEQTHAQTLFAYACALGYPAGCTNRAAGVKNGAYDGDPFPDPERPETATCLFRSFRIACEREDAWGCAMHGMSLQYGEGVSTDKDAARKAYDKSCEIDPSFAACETAREQVKEMDAPAEPQAQDSEAPRQGGTQH